jgi:hypothetical protein
MVSVLPPALKRKSRGTRIIAKAVVVFVVLVFVLVYYASTHQERKPSVVHVSVNNFEDLYLHQTILEPNVTDPGNETDPDDGCAVMSVPLEDRCAYIQNTSACSDNVYIKLQWCDFINLQWLFYILAV